MCFIRKYFFYKAVVKHIGEIKKLRETILKDNGIYFLSESKLKILKRLLGRKWVGTNLCTEKFFNGYMAVIKKGE